MPGLDRRSGGAAPAPRPAPGLTGDWRRRGWGIAVLLSALAVFGLTRLRFDDDVRALVRGGSADFELVDEVAAVFGGSDHDCLVRARSRAGDVFAPDALAALAALAERLGSVPGVDEVRSLFDVRRQGAVGALLPVVPRSSLPLDAADLAAARRRALDHPLVAGHLLAADAASALIVVRLDAAADQPARVAPVLAGLEAALAAADDGPLQLELTGLPVLRVQALAALRRDMLIFNSLGLSLAVILSASIARSLRSTIVACVPPTVGAIWALGVLGLCGAPVNILTSVVPSLALVVGTCDSIHFIEDMRRSARRGIAPLAAATQAVKRVGGACGLTSIVTAIGFASLAVARIEAVRRFGIAAAVGALASFAAVTLLTPLLAATPFCRGMRLGRSSRRAGRLAGTLAAFSVRHARPLAGLACAATAALALVGATLDADNRVADSLPADAPAARALARVDAEFGGTMGIDVVVGWPADIDWRDPLVTDVLQRVEEVLGREAGISRAISLATVTEPLPARARRRLDAGDLADLVAPDERLALVRARASDLGSRRLETIYGRIEAALGDLQRAHPGWRIRLAGTSVVSARNIRQLVHDLGSSLGVEVLVIGLILAAAFRSPLAGIVSLVPNVFPLTVIAATLVATGRALDPATVIVFNVCLGLAVDDTVHLLAAIARQRREGISAATAVRRAVAETGNPVVIGGLVLAVGFAAVTASSVPTLAGFGLLACAAVVAATVAELLFLPALLVVTESVVRRWSAADGGPGARVFRDRIFGAPAPAPLATPQPSS